MKNYKEYFKGKKITVMGLGLLGRGLGDVKFLAECGADLIVTDLKKEEDLKTSLDELKDFKNIKYTLGKHDLADFRDRDFILKIAGTPIDSPYIALARKNNIPIEMSTSLFAKLSGANIIGITGTRGKSTVTHLVYHILKIAYKEREEKIFLGGNVKGVSTLAYLKKIKPRDIAILELDSWQLQGFGEAGLSPHMAIFTTFFSDHLNYYKNNLEAYLNDKSNIFKHQTAHDVLVVGNGVGRMLKEKYGKIMNAKMIVADPNSVPKDWKIKIPGEHNRYNISIAVAACAALDIPFEIIKKSVESFKGVPGRLEFKKKINGVAIYNDTTATTPEATVVALKSLGDEVKKNIVLILGGVDKNLDMNELVALIPVYAKAVVMLAGSGTERIRKNVCDCNIMDGVFVENSLALAFNKAMSIAKKGDIVLLSPAFASFGMFKNEFDRGEQFDELVKKFVK